MVQLLVQWKESTLALLNNLSPRHLSEESDPLPQMSMAQTKGPEESHQSYDHLSLITQYRTTNTNRANSSM